MHLKQLMAQRNALADAFDARVTELHTQAPQPGVQAAAATDALTLLDRTVQQQWQQLQRALDTSAQPARPAFRASQPATPAGRSARRPHSAAPDEQVVDVVAREVPDGG